MPGKHAVHATAMSHCLPQVGPNVPRTEAISHLLAAHPGGDTETERGGSRCRGRKQQATGTASGGREPVGEVIVMRAQVGDQLVVGPDRIGIVIGVPAADGSPPYVVKWLNGGHIALVQPDQYARIVPSGADPRPRHAA